jgi:hypothetical protein
LFRLPEVMLQSLLQYDCSMREFVCIAYAIIKLLKYLII